MNATYICNHRNISLEAVADSFDDSNVRLLRMRLYCLGCGQPMKVIGVRRGVSIDAPALHGPDVTIPFVVEGEEPDADTRALV